MKMDTKQKIAQEFSDQASEDKLVKKIDPEIQESIVENKTMKKTVMIVYIVLVILGIGTGFLLSGQKLFISKATVKNQTVNDGKTTGSADAKTFKDSAEGKLQKEGLDGEGTHQLIRPGGDSQTVYLLSSVIDLDQYVGKDVKVWGQTQAAEKAAWLMDVGKIELK
jgi:hypothetical protein